MSNSVIILAAGKGTRMESDLPKVLHHLAGAPMLLHVMKSSATLEPERLVIIAGHGADAVGAVARDYSETAQVVLQSEQLGTGHAVSQAKSALADCTGDVIVLYGDTPFVRPETLQALLAARKTADIVVLGFQAANAGRYGRLVMQGSAVSRIVEYKDASEQERAITFCNSGVICAKADVLFSLLEAVGNDNASKEYYLTDIVQLANDRNLSVAAVHCDEAETMGINSRAELAQAEASFQSRTRMEMMALGVSLTAPETVYFAYDTVLGRDSQVEPNVVFGPGVTVENGARIRAFSHLEGCHISSGAVVGPYARLRPGTELAENVRIGNFVEIKNARIEDGAKVNHLSYIGDANIGEASNIGAGTVTCNYDGVGKHHTEIGASVFIGSNTMLVAPVTVGDAAMTASGSVITKNVEPGALAIARSEQSNKPGLAVKLFAMLRRKKVKQQEGIS
ncbi:MAG TPA: bifunctional UDP-N-acetylglucosamine diphosphorylase/glucosamine-1-phosphate N-acetyltransferase GlmU [Rhodobacteraceae bacterium]|nr:bifunctional UDP-N-acetylglucosamine diphosphorylase/glucosamine-1-phosphate N-acetyltransferase GlmU [Paracoccaceae bacterium]|tara:strand:- start:706 stop:2061 length:1356 start_codon:yes stop_codon:yes gene_type:complete